MPFQNYGKFQEQKQANEVRCTSSVSNADLNLERKIDDITKYQKPYIKKIFIIIARTNPQNANTLCNFIVAQKNEQNIKESTIEGIIKKLVWLSSYLNHKSFSEMTKEDILGYLNSIKKPHELDPTHKSIGTYNGRQMVFSTFFRWLYNQDESDYKRRITPPCMNGVKRLPRQERSPYKPSDLWTGEEHEIFLKYCPNKRDKLIKLDKISSHPTLHTCIVALISSSDSGRNIKISNFQSLEVCPHIKSSNYKNLKVKVW